MRAVRSRPVPCPNQVESDLEEVRDALLRGLRVEVGLDDGSLAFERHQLLAIRFTRAARLAAPSRLKNHEGQMWCRYFEDYFPRGDGHEKLLWDEWRTPLLKDEVPGGSVLVSHGQPDPHWQLVLPGRRLFINLESMWDDYEESVRRLVAAAEIMPVLRKRLVSRYAERQWRVETVSYVVRDAYKMAAASAASATASK